MKVAIAGGGIGGLTLALALHDRGIDVTIFEAVRELRPLGVGLNVLPHGVKVLFDLGLKDPLVASAIQTKELFYFDKFGSEIWSEPKGMYAGFDYPQLAIRRGELHSILLDACRERLGAEKIRTGHEFQHFEQLDDGRVACTFADRNADGAPVIITTDVLVGADGIHSAVRAQLYPKEGEPKWAGQYIWRAVSEAEPFLSGKTMFMAGPSATKFIAYPVSQKHADRGSSLINWIAEITVDPSQGFPKEDWNRIGKIEDFMPIFENWDFGWINIPELIRKAEVIHEFPMVDRDPVDRWSFGAVTLLGDAAHPMYPNGSNGASSAILDALALAEALDSDGSVENALIAYQVDRLPATTKIVHLNRQRGPEQVLEIADQRAPNGFENIEDVIPRQELEEIAERYRRVGGFYYARTEAKQA
ncbi:flavin-dependent oxidoreductase [Marivita sp.]|uniref:flavin-dependent oxidoreductase n=1 Tax=Marivita sp. TaxID=2003365 RepID=UPI003A84B6E0